MTMLSRPQHNNAFALMLAACALLWLNLATRWDVRLADLSYDFAHHQFPLRHAWLTETLGHVWLKYLLDLLALGCALYAIWRWRQSAPASHARRQALAVLLGMLLIPLTISVLKHFSSMHCPWDVDRYGGYAPYMTLFDALPANVAPGQCFPAGHASTGLWLLSLVLWIAPGQRRGWHLALLLLPGVVLGVFQELRGAHFLSHTLWSVWLSWAIISALAAWLTRHAESATTQRTESDAQELDFDFAGDQPGHARGTVR